MTIAPKSRPSTLKCLQTAAALNFFSLFRPSGTRHKEEVKLYFSPFSIGGERKGANQTNMSRLRVGDAAAYGHMLCAWIDADACEAHEAMRHREARARRELLSSWMTGVRRGPHQASPPPASGASSLPSSASSSASFAPLSGGALDNAAAMGANTLPWCAPFAVASEERHAALQELRRRKQVKASGGCSPMPIRTVPTSASTPPGQAATAVVGRFPVSEIADTSEALTATLITASAPSRPPAPSDVVVSATSSVVRPSPAAGVKVQELSSTPGRVGDSSNSPATPPSQMTRSSGSVSGPSPTTTSAGVPSTLTPTSSFAIASRWLCLDESRARNAIKSACSSELSAVVMLVAGSGAASHHSSSPSGGGR